MLHTLMNAWQYSTVKCKKIRTKFREFKFLELSLLLSNQRCIKITFRSCKFCEWTKIRKIHKNCSPREKKPYGNDAHVFLDYN